MADDVLVKTLANVVRSSSPLVLAAIGETFTERAGIVNLSLDGSLMLSALAGFVVAINTQSIIIGTLAAMLVGMVIALIVAAWSAAETLAADSRRRITVSAMSGSGERASWITNTAMHSAAPAISAPVVALACHVSPDGDALGSMLGLLHVLRAANANVVASFPPPFVVAPHYRELPGLELLIHPDEFTASRQHGHAWLPGHVDIRVTKTCEHGHHRGADALARRQHGLTFFDLARAFDDRLSEGRSLKDLHRVLAFKFTR